MRPKLLFPSYFRAIGIVLLIPGLVLGFYFTFYHYVLPFLSYGPRSFFRSVNNFTDEWIITFILGGELLMAFSRLKNESRITHRVRLNALYWAIVFNCVLVLGVCLYIGLLALFKVKENNWIGFPVYYILYNPLLILPVYYARFKYLLNRVKKGIKIKPIPFIPDFPYGTIGKTIAVLFIIVLAFSLAPSMNINVSGDTFTWAYVLLILPSLLLVVWTKEKHEAVSARLRAMQITVYINFGLLLIATWAVYGAPIFDVLELSFASIQIIFMLVFYVLRCSGSTNAQQPFTDPIVPTPGL